MRFEAGGIFLKTDFYHELVWKRFIRMPYGHVLDYTDSEGTVYIPMAEECEKAMPNPLGWWTPIENGAFFTGLYTYALLEKYKKDRNEKTAREIGVLVNGLFLLQDIGTVEGFIARGVAEDGKSHFPISSEDQFVPWVLALYAYYKSDLCKCKEQVKDRLLRALTAVREYGWKIPCDVRGLYRDEWADAKGWRGISKLLFCARVIFELTGDEEDLWLFERLAAESPQDCIFTRLEIVSQGYAHDMIAYLGIKQSWICVCAHLAIRELLALDARHGEYYKTGLYNNGVTALLNIDEMKTYDNNKDGFDINWRVLNPLWEDYGENVKKGVEIAVREYSYWAREIVPHRHMEHEVLGNALFAAWIAITCGEKKISDAAVRKLKANSGYIDWEHLHLSYAFAAESGLIFADVSGTSPAIAQKK